MSKGNSNIQSLEIDKLLAFQRLELQFSPGITVIIGANSTGKTHLMKLAYAMLRALGEYRNNAVDQVEGVKRPHITNKLLSVFRPDDREVGRLVYRTVGQASGSATLKFSGKGSFYVGITRKGAVKRRFAGEPPPAIFIPSREVLSIYPGFIAAYEGRELAFDETYYDLCKALSAAQLRGPREKKAAALIDPLLSVLGGRIALEPSGFKLKSKKTGSLEAPLLSEGFRKLGTLAHMIANGSLTSQSVLFWDEPEANLNPRLVTVMAKMLRNLASSGTQIIIATHDFLLSQELSLAAEHEIEPNVPMSFVALSRDEKGNVECQSAPTLVELKDNPILAEFAAHYDREQNLILAETSVKEDK
ncbi:MAG TPA: AAA family ATPase [Tepidisphaeraceae bacterium]|jgi:energy-coupling factor transporter ATP-binding protein EcfA2|nr:AAA family ATPase [Tepidisphaeraceae bacterium]